MREHGDEAAGNTVGDGRRRRRFFGQLLLDFGLGAQVVDCGDTEGEDFGASGWCDVAGVGAAVDEVVAGGTCTGGEGRDNRVPAYGAEIADTFDVDERRLEDGRHSA